LGSIFFLGPHLGGLPRSAFDGVSPSHLIVGNKPFDFFINFRCLIEGEGFANSEGSGLFQLLPVFPWTISLLSLGLFISLCQMVGWPFFWAQPSLLRSFSFFDFLSFTAAFFKHLPWFFFFCLIFWDQPPLNSCCRRRFCQARTFFLLLQGAPVGIVSPFWRSHGTSCVETKF